MKVLSLEELDDRWVEVEAALDATPEVDPWCSGPDWVIPVHRGFAPEADTLLLTTVRGSDRCFGMLARYRLADRRTMIGGLEPLWGFASPLVGADIDHLGSSLVEHLRRDADWDVLVVPGMPTPTGPDSFTSRAVAAIGELGRVRVGAGMTRQVADLGGGHDAWLARRSPRFRRNLRQATDRARREGVSFVDVSSSLDVFDRLLLIEGRSWKGIDDSGIIAADMATTYRSMVERLAARKRLSVHIARRDGADIGYILGGVRNGRYRGLQLSYTADARALSVGHLLQHHQVRLLCQSGVAHTYDLGMDLDYKRRWADRVEVSYTVVVERSSAARPARERSG